MIRLTATDSLFVYADSPKAPMNMGSVQIIRLPSGYQGDFFQNFKQFVAERIEYLPKLKMHLVADRVGLPVWAKYKDFSIDDHVHRTRVRSDDPMELYRKLGRLQHVSLDRNKPLFMFYVIEGLKDGRIAIMQKFHHAFADATTAIEVMNLFCDEGKPKKKRAGKQEHESAPWVLKRWITGTAEDLSRTVKSLPGAIGAATKLFGEGSREMLDRLRSRPRTIFNEPLSDDRLFAIRNWPMEEFTKVRRDAGLTFNDMGLVLFGGALRRYLDELDALPEGSLICNVPVGIDRKSGSGGNAVLAMWVPMGTNLADREERIRLIKKEADSCKKYLSAVLEASSVGQGIALPSFFMKPMAKQLGSEWINKLNPPPGNVAMSNVPAPAKQIHVAGAEVEFLYGLPMILHGQALSMTFTSYAGRIVIGILCCEKALPDPDRILDYMEDELQALKKIKFSPAVTKISGPARQTGKRTARRTKKKLKKKAASRT